MMGAETGAAGIGTDASLVAATSIGGGGGTPSLPDLSASLTRGGDMGRGISRPFVLADRVRGAPGGGAAGAGVVPGNRDMDLDKPWLILAVDGVLRSAFLTDANILGMRDSSFLGSGSRLSVSEEGVLSRDPYISDA